MRQRPDKGNFDSSIFKSQPSGGNNMFDNMQNSNSDAAARSNTSSDSSQDKSSELPIKFGQKLLTPKEYLNTLKIFGERLFNLTDIEQTGIIKRDSFIKIWGNGGLEQKSALLANLLGIKEDMRREAFIKKMMLLAIIHDENDSRFTKYTDREILTAIAEWKYDNPDEARNFTNKFKKWEKIIEISGKIDGLETKVNYAFEDSKKQIPKAASAGKILGDQGPYDLKNPGAYGS